MISPDVLSPAVRSMYTADQHEVYPSQPSSKMKISWYCLFTYTMSGISQPYVENLRHWELKHVDRKTHNDRWWFGMLYPPVNKVTTSPTAIQSKEYDNTGYEKFSVFGWERDVEHREKNFSGWGWAPVRFIKVCQQVRVKRIWQWCENYQANINAGDTFLPYT